MTLFLWTLRLLCTRTHKSWQLLSRIQTTLMCKSPGVFKIQTVGPHSNILIMTRMVWSKMRKPGGRTLNWRSKFQRTTSILPLTHLSNMTYQNLVKIMSFPPWHGTIKGTLSHSLINSEHTMPIGLSMVWWHQQVSFSLCKWKASN